MFSTLSRRWCSLFVALLLVLGDLLPVRAAPFAPHFSVGVNADCLSCSLAEQFPSLRSQLQGEMQWTATTRRFGKRAVTGLVATASSKISAQTPAGLKPLEQQAWMAMAERGQMQLFSPQSYNGSTVVEQGAMRVEVQSLGARSVRAQQQGKTLVYKNAYPSTDSLQVVKPGRSEEFLYLRNRTAPTIFDYQVKVSHGTQVRSEAGSIVFVDSRGRGVRIEKPWLMDSNGQRSESAVHWQMLEGGKHMRLVVEPQELTYPLVIDPSWTTTGSMTTARQNHTATLLPNGKVLVAGGSNGDGTLNSAELYNPQTGVWSTTGSMSTAREYYTSTLLPNGKVLVAGGNDGSADLYDPQLGTWSSTGSMATNRRFHTATLLPNGKVLVVGGFGRRVELYDPQTGTWSITGSLSLSRINHTATLLNSGKVLIAGGDFFSSSVELYDPQIGTWSVTGSMSMPRSKHTATLLPNGALLVAAGFNGSIGSYESSAELYGLSAPLITSFSPRSAGVGSVVTVTGSGFTGVTSAKVNGLGASFGYVSDSQLKLLVPAGATSGGPIVITTPAGSATTTTTLNVLGALPTITSFNATSGPVGTTVTIDGANFTGTTNVRFRTTPASFTVLSDSQIQAVVPVGAKSGAIVVITANGLNISPTKFTVTP